MEKSINESQKEFYECLKRKEEIEFTYNNNNYTIQPKGDQYEIWTESQGKILTLNTPSEALNTKYLNGKTFLELESEGKLTDITLF